jgi:hypothetical protein
VANAARADAPGASTDACKTMRTGGRIYFHLGTELLDETDWRVYNHAVDAEIDSLRVVDAFAQCAAAEQ